MEIIESEILKAENELLSALRGGDILRGLSIHLRDSSYHNIWNGEDKSYEALEQKLKSGMDQGLASIDYQVSKRDFLWINEQHVLQTLYAKETTWMNSGESISSPPTLITILWKKREGRWRLAYLHASDKPDEG